VGYRIVGVAGERTLRGLPLHPSIEGVMHEQVHQHRADYSPYAKDNFQFERRISGWRKLSLLDMRRKEYYSYVTWRDPRKRKRRKG
jgi:hypothetical protein